MRHPVGPRRPETQKSLDNDSSFYRLLGRRCRPGADADSGVAAAAAADEDLLRYWNDDAVSAGEAPVESVDD